MTRRRVFWVTNIPVPRSRRAGADHQAEVPSSSVPADNAVGRSGRAFAARPRVSIAFLNGMSKAGSSSASFVRTRVGSLFTTSISYDRALSRHWAPSPSPAIRSTSPTRHLYWGLDWSQGSCGFCCLPSSLPSRCKSSPSRGRKGISRRDLGRPMWITPSVCGGGSRFMCGTTSLPLKW